MSNQQAWAIALDRVCQERDDLKVKLEVADGIIRKLSDELFQEVDANYPPHLMGYPHNQQKRKNDMETVYEARDTLQKWKDTQDDYGMGRPKSPTQDRP